MKQLIKYFKLTFCFLAFAVMSIVFAFSPVLTTYAAELSYTIETYNAAINSIKMPKSTIDVSKNESFQIPLLETSLSGGKTSGLFADTATNYTIRVVDPSGQTHDYVVGGSENDTEYFNEENVSSGYLELNALNNGKYDILYIITNAGKTYYSNTYSVTVKNISYELDLIDSDTGLKKLVPLSMKTSNTAFEVPIANVKVVDSENVESTEYYEAITTEVYILPVVASVDATTTWNSITLTPSGTNGTNTIDHYEYSIDSGEYQTNNVFSNLNDNTQYTIRVKAIDSAGRESNVYETTVTTDTYELPVVNNVTVESTSNSITINVSATGGDGSIVSYHYSRDDGSNYQSSNNNSYTFNDLTSNTTFYIKVYVTDSNGRTSSEYSTSVTTKNPTLANYIINTVYTGTDGDNGLYYHDGTGRQVKLIKYDYATSNLLGTNGLYSNTYANTGWDTSYYKGSLNISSIGLYYWDSSSNLWQTSNLNIINLNTNYLNNIGSLWNQKIANSLWKTAGNSRSSIMNVSILTSYTNEIVNPSSNITYNAKIGLMYVSDYGYAASPENWLTNLYSYNNDTNRNNNWMYMGLNEWTISIRSDVTHNAYYIPDIGRLDEGYTDERISAIRPVFYLNSNVILTGGTGTQADPYRIS